MRAVVVIVVSAWMLACAGVTEEPPEGLDDDELELLEEIPAHGLVFEKRKAVRVIQENCSSPMEITVRVEDKEAWIKPDWEPGAARTPDFEIDSVERKGDRIAVFASTDDGDERWKLELEWHPGTTDGLGTWFDKKDDDKTHTVATEEYAKKLKHISSPEDCGTSQ